MRKMPGAVYSAAMGEIEQAHSPSGIQLNGHDLEHHFMPCSFHSSASSSPGVKRGHWTQTYSLDELLHSSCLCIALGTRVTERTRITSKRRFIPFAYNSSWRCFKAQRRSSLFLYKPDFSCIFNKTINFHIVFQ